MLKNKRGLSAVVTTLMIILLVLIAVGIIWVVVKNVIETGVEDIEQGAKCMGVDLSITSAKLEGTDYTIIVERGADDELLEGIKLIFSNADGESYGIDSSDLIPSLTNIEALGSESYTIAKSDLDFTADAETVEIAAYFEGSAGSEYCDKIDSYTISTA